jgi:hypothetical protein
MGISLKVVGGRFGWVENRDLNKYINEADIVFSLGRGIVEAIFAERLPFVLGTENGDGFVTTTNYRKIMYYNFSGRFSKIKFNQKALVQALKEYRICQPSKLRDLISNYFNSNVQIVRLINIYKQVLARPAKISKINYLLLKHLLDLFMETKYIAQQEDKIYFNNLKIKDRLTKKWF